MSFTLWSYSNTWSKNTDLRPSVSYLYWLYYLNLSVSIFLCNFWRFTSVLFICLRISLCEIGLCNSLISANLYFFSSKSATTAPSSYLFYISIYLGFAIYFIFCTISCFFFSRSFYISAILISSCDFFNYSTYSSYYFLIYNSSFYFSILSYSCYKAKL